MVSNLGSTISILPSFASRGEIPSKKAQHSLAKGLRTEQPTAAQCAVNDQIGFSVTLWERQAGVRWLPPVHALLKQTKKLSPPACVVLAADNRESHLGLQPLPPLAGPSDIGCKAAPAKGLQPVAIVDQSADGIKVNVVEQRPKAVAGFDKDRLVASSEEMAPQPMSGVDPPCIGVLQPALSLCEVGFRRLQQQMIVVAHEHPGVHPETRALATLSERPDKSPPVLVVADNQLSPVPRAP